MNDDTVCLLRECDAGCKSATNSMEQIMEFTEDDKLKDIINKYNKVHIKLGEECTKYLKMCNEGEKDPSVSAKIFSWVSTETKLMINDSNNKIADILIDGCNMGIKSVGKYKNQYSEAKDEAKLIAEQIINAEQDFMKELLAFL